MQIEQHKSPLIIYTPGTSNKSIIQDIASQLDIYPTIMGMLRIPYTNNSMGIDLFKEKREYAFFYNNKNLGVIDNNYYSILRKKVSQTLFKYHNNDLNNYFENFKAKSDSMRIYAYSMVQASQYLVKHKKLVR